MSQQTYSQEVHYVRDLLYVPLRSGQSAKHRIVHKGLASGTRLTLLESNSESGYSKVRTERGIEGWIPSQYISTEPSGRQLYEQEKKAHSQLKQQNTQLNQQLNELKTKQQQSSSEVKTLTAQRNKLSEELEYIKAISANAITLDSENKKLLEENLRLKNQTDVLSADNKRLQDNSKNDAFLNGAFAVVIGVMIALIVPRLRPKKSSEWA